MPKHRWAKNALHYDDLGVIHSVMEVSGVNRFEPLTRCHPEPKAKDLHFRLKLPDGGNPPGMFAQRLVTLNAVKDLHLFFGSQPIPSHLVTLAACMRDRTAPT